MNFLIHVFVFAFVAASLIAKESTAETRRFMQGIAMHCAELRQLNFPISEENFDYEVKKFEEDAAYLDKLLTRLHSMDPDAVNSTVEINGMPFAERLKVTFARIERYRNEIEAVRVEAPNPEALAKVDYALMVARQIMKGYNLEDGFDAAYQHYQECMMQAQALDMRAIEKRKVEIEKWGVPLVKKYEAAKKAVAEERAIADAKQREDQAKREENAKRYRQRAEAEAKALGYEDIEEGIANKIEELREGNLTLVKAKKILIANGPEDDFRVQNTVHNYVIFAFRSHDDLFQIALPREKDGFYGEGAVLNGRLFAVVGMEAFTTALGGETQILVLKRVR